MNVKTGVKVIAGAVMAGAIQTAVADDLTLCWASWDPANALVELSKDFEAESGHIKYELRVRSVAKLRGQNVE